MAAITEEFISRQMQESLAAKQAMVNDSLLLAGIKEGCDRLVAAYRNGNKALLGGNGGSAADAQHIAAELVSRFYFDRPSLPAIALTTDTSILTAISNDYGYEQLFARQLQANGRPGDVFVAISTSGNSKNIINGLLSAKQQGIITIGLAGADGGAMTEHCDLCIHAPSTSTPRIQECHILIGHILCSAVEEALFGQDQPSG